MCEGRGRERETICRLSFEKCMSQSKWKKLPNNETHKTTRRREHESDREGPFEWNGRLGIVWLVPFLFSRATTKYCGLLLGAI